MDAHLSGALGRAQALRLELFEAWALEPNAETKTALAALHDGLGAGLKRAMMAVGASCGTCARWLPNPVAPGRGRCGGVGGDSKQLERMTIGCSSYAAIRAADGEGER